MRIELTYAAWKAAVLPLNYTRILQLKNGVSDENRTHDPLIKSQLLYHLSYRDIGNKWLGHLGSNQGNDRVKVCCLTTWLYPNQPRPIQSYLGWVHEVPTAIFLMVEKGGFEPPNPKGVDLQSTAFSHFATSPKMVPTIGIEPTTY